MELVTIFLKVIKRSFFQLSKCRTVIDYVSTTPISIIQTYRSARYGCNFAIEAYRLLPEAPPAKDAISIICENEK